MNCKALAAEAKGFHDQVPKLFSKVANSRDIRLIDLDCSYAEYRKKYQKKEVVQLPLKQSKPHAPKKELQPKM